MTFETGVTGAAAWPPAALRGRIVFRHWRATGLLRRTITLLDAADLDPGFTPPSPTFKKCLDAWRASATPSAINSHVSLVDVSGGGYIGLRDREVKFIASSAKVGIMYPVIQLIHDLCVVEERVKPANDAALYRAMRQQWAKDLVDARAFGNLATALAWITANGPKLERCAKLSPTTKITPELNKALEDMVTQSDDAGRSLCIQLVGEIYITSVLSQSGELSALNPLLWTSSTRALAALGTLAAKHKLVSPLFSIWMLALLRESASDRGKSTWTRYALEGFDGGPSRPYTEIAGKIGFLYGGPVATWFDNVTVMADMSLVSKPNRKIYALAFATPFFNKVIRKGDIFPLIRAAHDCV